MIPPVGRGAGYCDWLLARRGMEDGYSTSLALETAPAHYRNFSIGN